MQLTTPQLYALAVMAVLTIILIGISYVSGLRTGRKAGKETGYENGRRTEAAYRKTIIAGIQEKRDAVVQDLLKELDQVRSAGELAIAEASGLRKQLNTELKVTERLDRTIKRLVPKAFHSEDLLTLNLAARQLGIAAKAHTRSGSNKPNQAELAQQALKEIVARVAAAGDDVIHPDTELLDWLQMHGEFLPGVAKASIRFPYRPTEIGTKSFRDLIKHAQAATPATAARDEDGYPIPAPIDYMGDGKGTWQRTDEEQRALGLPAAQCL